LVLDVHGQHGVGQDLVAIHSPHKLGDVRMAEQQRIQGVATLLDRKANISHTSPGSRAT
jgi:hypothetical protein